MKNRTALYIVVLLIVCASAGSSQWIPVNYTFFGKLLHVENQNIIAGGPPFHLSTDGGRHWTTSAPFGFDFDSIYSMDARGDTILVGCGGRICIAEGCSSFLPSLFRSTNGGLSWDTVLSTEYGSPAVVIGPKYFFSNPDTWFGRSSDGGSQWTKAQIYTFPVHHIFVVDTVVYVSDPFHSLAKSRTNGESWIPVPWTYEQINELVGAETKLFITTDSGIYRSSDIGISWTKFITGIDGIHQMVLVRNNLFALRNDSVYTTTADLLAWSNVSTGIYAGGHPHLYSLATNGDYLFATTDYGIWKRPLSEMITGVTDRRNQSLPVHFSLGQNYPNPFNPETEIEYQISEVSRVSLKILDVLGREVTTLVDEIETPGEYTAVWDASGKASGVYFYRITAGRVTETKKMLLLR